MFNEYEYGQVGFWVKVEEKKPSEFVDVTRDYKAGPGSARIEIEDVQTHQASPSNRNFIRKVSARLFSMSQTPHS